MKGEYAVKYSLPYGKYFLEFSLPAGSSLTTLEANPSRPLADIRQAVSSALASPTGTLPLKELVHAGEKVVIVTSDITRLSFRTDAYLPVILDVLNSAGIPDADISVVMATGSHRVQTAEEHRLIVGDEAYGRVRVIDHRCDAPDLAPAGVTSRGTEITVNRWVAEADRLIVTGGVSYHLLAGFGGGRKSLVPGVCSCRGIQQNHSLALTPQGVHPMVSTGVMDGNPAAEDMLEGARLLEPDFLVNVVVNERQEIVSVVAGELEAAFLAGCRVVEETFGVKIPSQADLVIASCGGYPKDIQLYQAIKGLDNAAYAVRPDAPILLLAECSDGLGSRDFLRWFDYGGPAAIQQVLEQEFTMPGFVALRTAEILAGHPVYLLSGLEADTAERLGMRPVRRLDQALDHIFNSPALGGEIRDILLMPHASLTFPILASVPTPARGEKPS